MLYVYQGFEHLKNKHDSIPENKSDKSKQRICNNENVIWNPQWRPQSHLGTIILLDVSKNMGK